MLNEVNEYLESWGNCNSTGTIVDATIILRCRRPRNGAESAIGK